MPLTGLNSFPHNAPHPPTAFGHGPLPLPKGEGQHSRPLRWQGSTASSGGMDQGVGTG